MFLEAFFINENFGEDSENDSFADEKHHVFVPD